MSLAQFCTTERQRKVIELHEKGVGSAKIGKQLGMDAGSVRYIVRTINQRAIDRGYDPEHHREHVLPPGQVVSGYSDLVRYPEDDPMGRVIGWVKSNRRIVEQISEAQTMVEAMAADIPKAKPVKFKGNPKHKHHFSVLPIGDPHIGLRVWAKETGTDWDVPIAQRVFGNVFRRLMERTPDTDEIVVFNSGDFFHADNMAGETERSGHKLDLDGRPGYWLHAGVSIMRTIIDMALVKYKKVHFVNTPGNHDQILSLALGVFMSHMYENEPRFTCDRGTNPFQYFERGKVGLGFCHGHTCKLASLPGKMADDMAEMWGRVLYRHWITGHVHHNQWLQWKEHPGCTVESVGIIPPKDAYAHGAGYGARRGTQLIIMDDRGFQPPDRYTESVWPED